jgi:hypothetical protein
LFWTLRGKTLELSLNQKESALRLFGRLENVAQLTAKAGKQIFTGQFAFGRKRHDV